jgi:lincosamide nucleotidyltransferase
LDTNVGAKRDVMQASDLLIIKEKPMDSQALKLSDTHRDFLSRFVAACQADERVVAAFIGGSYATGTADAYSDLDLSLITTDAAFDAFFADRAAFLQQLGTPVFLENFGQPKMVFFIFSDDTEGELWFGSPSHLDHIQSGPYRVLLDKQDVLAGAVFPERESTQAEQIETLRRQITWFWHDLSHFITAIRRGQWLWAHGQLEALRLYGINLARLRQNFLDGEVGSEGYWKLERALPVAQLAPLQATYCPLDRAAMLQAARVIIRFYQEQAQFLTQTHGIAYPAALERVMLDRLDTL